MYEFEKAFHLRDLLNILDQCFRADYVLDNFTGPTNPKETILVPHGCGSPAGRFSH